MNLEVILIKKRVGGHEVLFDLLDFLAHLLILEVLIRHVLTVLGSCSISSALLILLATRSVLRFLTSGFSVRACRCGTSSHISELTLIVLPGIWSELRAW